MSSSFPKIDSRNAKALYNALRKTASVSIPEWRETNEGDFGDGFLKIVAHLVEYMKKAHEDTPRRDMTAFYNALDLSAEWARPAMVPLTFQVSEKRNTPIFTAAGTQVAASTDTGEVIFETRQAQELTPARLSFLVITDGEEDRIGLAPPGFLDLAPSLEAQPPYSVRSISVSEPPILQVSPIAGLNVGDEVMLVASEINPDTTGEETDAFNTSVYRVSAIKDTLITLDRAVSLPNDISSVSDLLAAYNIRIKRVIQLKSRALRNQQNHYTYLSHGSLLSLSQGGKIELSIEGLKGITKMMFDTLLKNENIVFTLFAVNDEGLSKWVPLDVNAFDGAVSTDVIVSLQLKKKYESVLFGLSSIESYWIRLDFDIPSTSSNPTPSNLVSTDQIKLRVEHDSSQKGSVSLITAAYHNTTPLSVATEFLPFGSEPLRFDTFSLAIPQALSKASAKVEIKIGLGDIAFQRSVTTRDQKTPKRVYAITNEGKVAVVTDPDSEEFNLYLLDSPSSGQVVESRSYLNALGLGLSLSLDNPDLFDAHRMSGSTDDHPIDIVLVGNNYQNDGSAGNSNNVTGRKGNWLKIVSEIGRVDESSSWYFIPTLPNGGLLSSINILGSLRGQSAYLIAHDNDANFYVMLFNVNGEAVSFSRWRQLSHSMDVVIKGARLVAIDADPTGFEDFLLITEGQGVFFLAYSRNSALSKVSIPEEIINTDNIHAIQAYFIEPHRVIRIYGIERFEGPNANEVGYRPFVVTVKRTRSSAGDVTFNVIENPIVRSENIILNKDTDTNQIDLNVLYDRTILGSNTSCCAFTYFSGNEDDTSEKNIEIWTNEGALEVIVPPPLFSLSSVSSINMFALEDNSVSDTFQFIGSGFEEKIHRYVSPERKRFSSLYYSLSSAQLGAEITGLDYVRAATSGNVTKIDEFIQQAKPYRYNALEGGNRITQTAYRINMDIVDVLPQDQWVFFTSTQSVGGLYSAKVLSIEPELRLSYMINQDENPIPADSIVIIDEIKAFRMVSSTVSDDQQIMDFRSANYVVNSIEDEDGNSEKISFDALDPLTKEKIQSGFLGTVLRIEPEARLSYDIDTPAGEVPLGAIIVINNKEFTFSVEPPNANMPNLRIINILPVFQEEILIDTLVGPGGGTLDVQFERVEVPSDTLPAVTANWLEFEQDVLPDVPIETAAYRRALTSLVGGALTTETRPASVFSVFPRDTSNTQSNVILLGSEVPGESNGEGPEISNDYPFIEINRNESVEGDGANSRGWTSKTFLRDFQNPELSWEYFDGSSWNSLMEYDFVDGTAYFSRSGAIRFTVPENMSPTEIAGKEDYWVRARLVGGDFGRPIYKVITEGDTQRIEVERPFNPPQISRVDVKYTVIKPRVPEHVLVENNLDIKDQTTPNSLDGVEYNLIEEVSFFNSGGLSNTDVTATPGPFLYLGFTKSFKVSSLSIFVDVDENDEELPAQTVRLKAEVLGSDSEWQAVSLNDQTKGMSRRGFMSVGVISEPLRARLFGQELFWLRFFPDPSSSTSKSSTQMDTWQPCLKSVFINSIPATEGRTYQHQILGSTIGEPNLSLSFGNVPVLPDSLELRVRENLNDDDVDTLNATDKIGDLPTVAVYPEISLEGYWVRWRQVDSLLGQAAEARVFTLDPRTGVLSFGDDQQGRIPPAGQDSIRAITYQSGGGLVGNVPAYSLTSLKTAIESFEGVANPVAAIGGTAEPVLVEELRQAPHTLRHRGQALTPPDIEAIAVASSPDLVRARCFYPNPNSKTQSLIRVVIAMRTGERCPKASRAVRDLIKDRILTQTWGALSQRNIVVVNPSYVDVSADITLVPKESRFGAEVEREARARLRRFFDAIDGGPPSDLLSQAAGWPFGRSLYKSDLCRLLSSINNLDRVEINTLKKLGSGSNDNENTDVISIGREQLICAKESDIRLSITLLQEA